MDTELLKTFLEVEKTRHFARAADNLYLTHAAVSARVKQLEGLIGSPLFTRYRNNITLTTAGERLKPFALSILSSWNRAVHESHLADGQISQLAIGGTANLWDSILQDYLHQVYVAYPNITLRAECHGSDLLVSQLVGRTLDMVVLFDPPKLEGYSLEKVQDIDLILVSSLPSASPDGISVQQYIQVDWGVSFGIKHAKLSEFVGKPTLHTSTGRIALDFILQHGGSAYLPDSFVQPYLDIGQFHKIDGAPTISRSVFAAYLKDSAKKSLLEEVTSMLKNNSFLAAPTLKP
jgi:DNA-binding transcriptional LysR family regulator